MLSVHHGVDRVKADNVSILILHDVTNAAGVKTIIKYTAYGPVARGGLIVMPDGKMTRIIRVLSTTEMMIEPVDKSCAVRLKKKDRCAYIHPEN